MSIFSKETSEARAKLLSRDADMGRIARRCRWVVWVEGPVMPFWELDADSLEHARVLAQNWVRPELGASVASVRSVRADGKTIFREMFTAPEPDNAS